VWSRTDSSIERTDGMRPPGKMYLWIHVHEALLAIMRSCGVVIAWSPALPPGASTRSSTEKYSGQCSAPTASILSTLTTASY
jgi:hypothetical protein